MEPRQVAYDVAGAGTPVVLIHSDVADARLWSAQVDALAPSHLVVTYDRPGFGRTPLPAGSFSQVADLRGLLDELALERISLVGCSGGGNVALDFAVTHPERVERLVLVAPGLAGWDWSAELQAADEEETRLFEAGDDEAAAEAQVRLWADGTRSADEVARGRDRAAAHAGRASELRLRPGPPGLPAAHRCCSSRSASPSPDR